jgi:hypothetical protein
MTGCAVTHDNCIGTGTTCGSGATAIGQSYWLSSDYCAALGVPGTDSTYSLAMVTAAAAAAPQPDAAMCSQPPCIGVATCTNSNTAEDAYYDDLTDTGGPCYVWTYASTTVNGTKHPSGHVYMDKTKCDCPLDTDPTWD